VSDELIALVEKIGARRIGRFKIFKFFKRNPTKSFSSNCFFPYVFAYPGTHGLVCQDC
jgi:hypothetical protein